MEEESLSKNIVEEEANPSPSCISSNESPGKCNLSLSFNFDFNDVNSVDSSDSETADLQIDVSEIDNYVLHSKHKRDTVEETSSVINEMEEEIERQLDAKAAKTNLTATNVKNILKHVITNEHVMAMVKNRLQDTEDDILFEPKLTRAKAKELAAAQVNIPWPITPLKKTSSEVQALIEEELPEDSSDEEYNPEQDKQSDDEREAENSTNNDVDSHPFVPVNTRDSSSIEQPKSVDVQYDPEGIFKIPGIPHVPTEEESIGQRTRSKLCLSETPLEQIEQAFIPPDITIDMYNWDWDGEIDEDWDNFLKEFTQPLTQEPVMEDDTEADPEYNILEDEETDLLDKEELRADKAVKVTRKELNNLIAELFDLTDTFTKQEQEISKKKKFPENSSLFAENNSMNGSETDHTCKDLPDLINSSQRQLLTIQFRQHIQLMAQHFAMTYMDPQLHSQSKTCKENLNSIKYLSKGTNSAFNIANLPDALKLVSDWENQFLDNKFAENFRKSIREEDSIKTIYSTNKWKYVPKFHPELAKLFMESKALMYPQLLPKVPFKGDSNKFIRNPCLKSEDCLIALGLEQFVPFVASKPRKFKSKKIQLMDAVQLIIEYLLPRKDPQGLFNYIQKHKSAKDANPIKHYFEKGYAPRTIHYITLECDLKAPKDQPINFLPLEWQPYLNNAEQKIDLLKRKHILNSYNDLMKKDFANHSSKNYAAISNSHLCNPVVNMFPKILPLSANQKSSSKATAKSVSCVNRNAKAEDLAKIPKKKTKVVPPNLSATVKEEHGTSSRNDSLEFTTTDEEKEKERDRNELKEPQNNEPPNSAASKQPKLSKKSVVVQELPSKATAKSVSCVNRNAKAEDLAKIPKEKTKVVPPNLRATVTEEHGTSSRSDSLESTATDEEKEKERDRNELKEPQNDEPPNSASSKQPKLSKKSVVVQELPQLRRTKPRLAKTRSAQNMKLMAQILGSKGVSSNCNALKSREKNESNKNVEKMSLPKIDNEEEIAELMLASTTIKKNSVNRKKARELENIKRLLEAENPLNEEERASKFAASYFQKLHLTVESSSPETFRSVIKLYLDYSEKLDSINQMETDLSFPNTPGSSQSGNIRGDIAKDKDTVAINLYWDVCEKLHAYPELCTDFLLFLKPHQAAMMGKSVEYIMLQKMSEFINVAQVYFAKQPSRIAKIMQAITQLSSDPQTTLEQVHTTMSPILKGHPLVMDLFLQIIPTAKPPESLFASHMFENLTCPVGPHDKSKVYTEGAPELYENIDLPVLASQEDPYGGENCRCNCHNGDDSTCKNTSEHCVSCGTRFLNGRMYLQTSEGLRPAKIIFPGADEEKLENIARVSLKTTDKFVPSVPSKQRRKSSKNEPAPDEQYQKPCTSKASPVKDNSEDGGKVVVKPKKAIRSPPKAGEQKKGLKRPGSTDHVDVSTKKMRISQCRSKREKKTDKHGAKIESLDLHVNDDAKLDEPLCVDSKNSVEKTVENVVSNVEAEVSNDNRHRVDSSGKANSADKSSSDLKSKPWTRQEDMILLQTIKKEYSENSIATVSNTLGDRTVDQVRERCETLLSLLQKMM